MPNERVIPSNANASVLTFTIKIDGEAIPTTIKVRQLIVSKELNRITSAKLVILDGDPATEDFPVSNEELFIPGKDIEIYAGYQSEEDILFKGIIIKHGIQMRQDGTTLLKIECKDPAVKMTIGRNNRVFKDSKDTDAIKEIIEEYDLQNEVTDSTITHQDLVQYSCTDWDFIINRAELNAMVCLTADGVFKIFKPDTSPDPVLELYYGANILSFDAEIDARDQYSSITSSAWSYTDQKIVETTGADPEVEEPGNLSASDLSGVIDKSFLLQHSGQIPEDELQIWADAGMLKSKLSKIRGRIQIQGYALITPGDMVSINGMGERFNGKAFVSGISHQLSNGEWVSDIQIGLNADWFTQKQNINPPLNSGLLAAVSGLQIGVVIQLQDDPDGEYRALVKIPILSTEEDGVWARMSLPDAGNNRGFFFRPEIDDEVIIGFINNDPREAIILGGVHSSSQTAPLDPADDNYQKGYFSKEELKLTFDDEVKAINLETPAGNKVALSEDDGGISIEDENGNKIVLDSNGISIESAKDIILKAESGDIKIEGINVEAKAQAQFVAKGSAGVEMSSSATAVLKGALVQIN